MIHERLIGRLAAGLVWLSASTAMAAEDTQRLIPSNVPLPDRTYDWNLPSQPNRPWQPMPHFDRSPILPERIEFNTIPKTNLRPEHLRPPNLEDPALTLNVLEREDIMPPHLVDAPLAPRHLAPPRENHPDTPYAGSMIFLPELPPPQDLHLEHPLIEGKMPEPDHRRDLGW